MILQYGIVVLIYTASIERHAQTLTKAAHTGSDNMPCRVWQSI